VDIECYLKRPPIRPRKPLVVDPGVYPHSDHRTEVEMAKCMSTRDKMIKHLTNRLQLGRVLTIVGTGVLAAATGNQEIAGCKVTSWPG
jgi:hypothetical protein